MSGDDRLFRVSRRGLLRYGAALAAGPLLAAPSSAQSPARRFAAGPAGAMPPRPWAEAARRQYPPGRPGDDYTPVFTPNGWTLPFEVRNGAKVFHLVAEPIEHEIVEGLRVQLWGFNGTFPGPTIEAVAGDRVRIYVTNRLPAPTSVHWHAILLPCGMDGISSVTQHAIKQGETFRYEFIFTEPGSFMYHSHLDSMTQDGMGQVGTIVVHPRNAERRPDRDFAIMLHEMLIEGGAARADPNEMADFNILTMNGKAFPDTHPLVARLGDCVRIRIGNLSQIDHHPVHLHGHRFWVTQTDGGPIPPEAQWPETSVLVSVGQTRTIELTADNPGDWLMHCHMTHHMMNQMGHDFPNMIGVEPGLLDAKIRKLLPDYMTMGASGMHDMAEMNMKVPLNSVPMKGLVGQFGRSILGGMMTVLKVREQPVGYADPGWYDFPPGTVARPADPGQLAADGIDPDRPPRQV